MARLTVKLNADTSAVTATMAEVLSLVDTADCPVKARNRFLNSLIGLFEKGSAMDFDQLPASGVIEAVLPRLGRVTSDHAVLGFFLNAHFETPLTH